MATDWKSTLTRTASVIGRGLLFLARHLLALLVAASRFIVLRAIPATWRWLRGSAFPAMRRFYLWLPHRRVVVGVCILVIAAGGAWMYMAISPGTGHSARNDKPIRVARHDAQVVDRLLSGDWQAQKDATRGVLASIGVMVLDGDAPPAAGNGLQVAEAELVMLTMDGARKPTTSRVSLAELAQMLKDFGFPFPEGRRPAQVMEEGVRAWVAEGLKDADAPGAEAARFLHAMAARQQPAIDLSSPDWVAEQYGLTHLELFVFNAAVIDVFPSGKQPATSAWRAPADLFADLLFPKAHAGGVVSAACSVLKDLYGEFYVYDGNKKNMQNIFGLGQSTAGATEGAAKGLAKAAGAISTLFKLHRLMLLYTSTEMRVTADQPFVHKPAGNEGGKEVTFVATVGIDEEKQREFDRKMKESSIMQDLTKCLADFGLPTPTDVGDIAKEVKNWDVSWNLYGDHATWSNKKNRFKSGNQRRAPLTPSTDGAHGESRFIVDIKREEHHEGDILTDYITGKATLHTDVMPGTEAVSAYAAAINSFKNGNELAGLLGLTGVTVGLTGGLMNEVLGGWAQRILDPEVSYDVAVAYHRLRYPGYSYEGEVKVTVNYEERTEKEYANQDGRTGHAVYKKYEQYFGNVTARMTTERASLTRYTDHQHDTVWRLSGQAESSASYERLDSSKVTGTSYCTTPSFAGRVTTVVEGDTWGSGSSSGPTTYGVSITQHALKKGEVRIHLQLNGAGGLVPYDKKFFETTRREPCEPSKISQEEYTVGPVGGVGVGSTGHWYTVSEPFPEQISGRKTVVSEDGNGSATWTWKFHRVGPFEDPDADAPSAGRN